MIHTLTLISRPIKILQQHPVDVLRALTLSEAIAMVQGSGWPDLLRPDTEDPSGLALYPPEHDCAPVVVEVGLSVSDAYGREIPQRRGHGVLGCIFSARRSSVLRLWFPGDAKIPTVGPVDIRASEVLSEPAVYERLPGGRNVRAPASWLGWTVGWADAVTTTEGGLYMPGWRQGRS